MPHTSQWTWVPVPLLIETSGSWKWSTKLRVPAGTLVHAIAGDTGDGTACVYFSGMSSPSGHAPMVSVNPGPAGAAGACAACCAGNGTASTTAKTMRNSGAASFMAASCDARELTPGGLPTQARLPYTGGNPARSLLVGCDQGRRRVAARRRPALQSLWPLASCLWQELPDN